MKEIYVRPFLDIIIKFNISKACLHETFKDMLNSCGVNTSDYETSRSSYAAWTSKKKEKGKNDRYRQFKVKNYSPNTKINYIGLFSYFYYRMSLDVMAKIQEKLCKDNYDSCIVDLETTDKHTFCWSLVNQFLQIIGLETILTPANYLKKVTEKYEETNNIIFTDKGMPFYDFYVPNNVSISKYKYTDEEKEKLSILKVKSNNLYRDIYKIEKNEINMIKKLNSYHNCETSESVSSKTMDDMAIICIKVMPNLNNNTKYRDKSIELRYIKREIAEIENKKELIHINAEYILSEAKYAIIEGKYKSGRTMLLRHLLLNCAKNFEKLNAYPIFIELKDYDDESESLEDIICKSFKLFDIDIGSKENNTFIKNNKFLFLFNHFDELDRKCVRIKSILENAPYNNDNFSIVISSYPGYCDFHGFKKYHIEPLTEYQPIELIKNLLMNFYSEKEKEEFIKICATKDYLKKLNILYNPLLATLLIQISEGKKFKIPENEYMFFTLAFETMYYSNETYLHYNKQEFEQFFMKFCHELCINNKYIISQKDFVEYFNKMKTDLNSKHNLEFSDFSDDVVNKLNLMCKEKDKNKETQYGFLHKSYQEYFFVSYILKKLNWSDIADLFEGKYWLESAFEMLYNSNPEEIEKNVFLPALKEVFDETPLQNSFLLFMCKAYCKLNYTLINPDSNIEETFDYPYTHFSVFTFILSEENLAGHKDLDTLPHLKDFIDKNHESDQDVTSYSIEIEVLKSNQEKYADVIDILMGDSLPFMNEYDKVKEYYHSLKKKYNIT